MKLVPAALALLFAVACSTSSLPNDVKNAPDYILLSSPNQIRTLDLASDGSPRGLHVRGALTNHGFRPAGEIQGIGQFCADGKDWLSLADLKVHSASDGKTPVAPYIVGCAKKSGFEPASRAIVAQ